MLGTANKEAALGITQMSLAKQLHSWRPSTSRTDENVARICELILEDSHRTIDELVDLAGVSWSSSTNRFWARNCKWQRVAAKFVLHKALSVQQAWPSLSTAIFTRYRSMWLLFIAPNERSPQTENVLQEKVKRKTTEASKSITLQKFQDCFKMWKTCLDSTLEIQFVTPKHKYTIFWLQISSFFWAPLHIYIYFEYLSSEQPVQE
jgi:hypothetical protein